MGTIGEAGFIRRNFDPENVEVEITFDRPLENAVISLTGTNSGGHQYTFRITEVTDTGFKFIVDEWDYLDGQHPAVETINWVAIEEGVHELPDGRIIAAGYADTSSTATSVDFDGAFTNTPVVLATALAEADINAEAVDSDPFGVTADGFDLILQEEEANDGVHGAVSVGWIAVDVGGNGDYGSAITHQNFDESNVNYSIGATYDNAIVVAETQTLNDVEAANIEIRSDLSDPVSNPITDSVNLRLREETSSDSETNHGDETLGIVAFEQGIIFCFTPGALIDTPEGRRPVEDLAPGDLVTTRDHGPRPIRFMARRQLDHAALTAAPHLKPVLIRKNALGDNLPDADIKVSPQHRMAISGWRAEALFGQQSVLVPAISLVNDRMIRVARGTKSIECIHILFDQHEIIFANGAPTESLFPGAEVVKGLDAAARAELFEIFPELKRRQHWTSAAPILKHHEARALGASYANRRPYHRRKRPLPPVRYSPFRPQALL